MNQLSKDSLENAGEWENGSIADYLERIASWVEDFSRCPQNDIDWTKVDYKLIARLFCVGKIYE